MVYSSSRRESEGRDMLIELIAELEHEQWVSWANSLLNTESLSPERVERWNTCLVPYDELSEEMKEHDRKWARKVAMLFDLHAGPTK